MLRTANSLRLIPMLAAALVAGVAGSAGCDFAGQPTVRGSGNVITDPRELTVDVAATIKAVDIRGSSDVEVRVNPTADPLLTVTTDDNIVPMILTTVDGSDLIISSRGNYRSSDGVRVEIVLPDLAALNISGSGDATVTGITTAEFRATVSGSGSIDVAGNSDRVLLTVTGSGDIDTTDIAAATASVTVTGSGDIDVFASNSAELVITGSGTIRCFGNPKVSMSVTGSGDIIMEDAP